MNGDMFVGILIGFVAGALLMLLAMKSFMRTVGQQIRDEDERNDPANWWKYGGSPYAEYESDNEE